MFNWLWYSVYQSFYLAFIFVRIMAKPTKMLFQQVIVPLIIWLVVISVSSGLVIVEGWKRVKSTLIDRWVARELEDKESTLDREPSRRKWLAVQANIWL